MQGNCYVGSYTDTHNVLPLECVEVVVLLLCWHLYSSVNSSYCFSANLVQ